MCAVYLSRERTFQQFAVSDCFPPLTSMDKDCDEGVLQPM